jgi:hypothetical protein
MSREESKGGKFFSMSQACKGCQGSKGLFGIGKKKADRAIDRIMKDIKTSSGKRAYHFSGSQKTQIFSVIHIRFMRRLYEQAHALSVEGQIA